VYVCASVTSQYYVKTAARIGLVLATPIAGHKQATVVGLSLKTLGDGGRDYVLFTLDRQPSPVDYTQRPALCAARWAIVRDATRRAVRLR